MKTLDGSAALPDEAALAGGLASAARAAAHSGTTDT